MNLSISGHHLEITPALSEYIQTKFEKIKKHFDQVIDIKVLLSIDKPKEKDCRPKAECTIHIKGHDIFAQVHGHDMYVAIDDLVHKLDRQVLRYKSQAQDHHTTNKTNQTLDLPLQT